MEANSTQLNLLAAWMEGKEDEQCEFKKAEQSFSFEDLGKYCSALANEGGGRIIFGVTDNRPRKVIGSRAFEQPERTRKGLCEKIPIGIDFDEIHHPDCKTGSRVLVFSVPGRPVGMPIKFDGRYWMRKEDSLVGMTEERLRAIFAESGHDFSGDPCEGLQLSDLDPHAIAAFRARWINKACKAGDAILADRLAALDHRQLLADCEAIVDEQLNYASLVLFGSTKAVGKYLSQAEVVFEYRSSETSGAAQERKEFRGGFFAFQEDLWDAINKRNDMQEYREDLFVTSIPTFSERPVREAVLNAVCHRDYQMSGSVFVRQFPRRLEVDSPGGLPHGITLENILDRQKPRNRRIAEICTKCGLVERSGQGMNLIYEDLIKASKPEPDFSRTDAYQVGLTLHGTVGDPAFIRFVEKVGKETTTSFTTHDWVIFSLASRGEKIPKGQEKRVRKLMEFGLIERGKGRTFILAHRYYAITGQKGVYTRKKGLDRDQNLALLLKHIVKNKETGSKLEELRQVLPALSASQVQSLVRSLQRKGEVFLKGRTQQGRWFPVDHLSRNDLTQISLDDAM